MTLSALIVALLALLLTPGPTNTLMALAGASQGWTRALRLIPAELAGYLLAVVPLTLAGEWVQGVPGLATLITAGAAAWVFWLALSLWRAPAGSSLTSSVSARKVFVTTLLNPKALVIGLVLLPSDGDVLPRLVVFAALVVVAAALWAGGGALLARRAGGGALPWLNRAAATWLALLSVLLAARALGA